MRKIKEIIRLSEKCSLSRKGIARSCGISKNTVKDYLERYEKSGITFDAIRDMNDQDVYWLLFPEKKEQKSEHERDKIDFAYLFRELKKKSVTLDQLYQEYKVSKPNGLGRSQFYYWYQQWLSSTEISMRQQHRGGETCYAVYGRKVLRNAKRFIHATVGCNNIKNPQYTI